jgi:hypothetical protein
MCSFSKPSTPAPIAVPDPEPLPAQPAATPQEQDPAVSTARQNERVRRLRASQANQTLVTGGQGLSQSATTGGKTLLGA